MHCLYCSKEIGLIKALKGSEYCNAAHRKKHGERLGKALSQMFAPEPPPAGMAGFFVELAPCAGNPMYVLAPWQSGPAQRPIRSIKGWHFAIVSTIGQPDAPCAPAPAVPEVSIPGQAPALPAPAAEPVERFVKPSMTRFIARLQADILPQFRIAPEFSSSRVLRQAPALAAAAAEPVARFVQPSAAGFVTLDQASIRW